MRVTPVILYDTILERKIAWLILVATLLAIILLSAFTLMTSFGGLFPSDPVFAAGSSKKPTGEFAGSYKTPSTQSPSTSYFAFGARNLSEGAVGPDVFELQYRLNLIGFYIKVLDGIFGKETKRAVIEFQKSNGLTPDGTVDREMFAKLLSASEPKSRPAGVTPAGVTGGKGVDGKNVEPTGINTGPAGTKARPVGSKEHRPVGSKEYLVRAGDTLSAIALRFGTTVEKLMALNNIKDPDVIRAGERLIVISGN